MHVVDTPELKSFMPGPSLYGTQDFDYYAQMHELLKKEGNSYLDEIEKLGKKMGVDILKKIVDGHPAEEIIKEAKKNDLIILGDKGKTGLNRLLIGSIAENVTRHASCPVMIVR